MARITDPKKLEDIKKATISMIVEKGFGGATISAIAAEAGVADGYLYRHYQSKDKLVKDLFRESASLFIDFLQKEFEGYTSFESFVAGYHKGLVDVIMQKPDSTKFFVQLINDFAFDIKDSTAIEQTLEICRSILETGKKNGEISDSTTLLDIYSIIIIIPLQTFTLLLRGFFNAETLTGDSATMVTQTCLKIID